MNWRVVSFRIIILLCLVSISAPGQWSTDPTVNTPVCTAIDGQYYPEIVALDSGGAIVAWHDSRPGTETDMYVQKFDLTGTAQWTVDGVALSTGAGNQAFKAITSDGAGGAIVVWQDTRYNPTIHDIYARRVNASGTPLWTVAGVPISVAGSHDEYPAIEADGAGGAFIAWGGTNLSVQKINSAGAVQWATNGISLVSGSGMYDNRWPKVFADDSGCVIVSWQHESFSTGWDIYAQRISGSGTVLWTPGGVPVCAASGYQEKPTFISDGSGGVIITWEDARNGPWDIYAQRIDRYGTPQWTPGGVPVCTANSDQRAPLGNTGTVSVITGDGAGGAIITWQDYRSGGWSVYAQRMDSSGTALWATNGVLLSAIGGQGNPAIISDDSGGAIVTWENDQGGTAIDIYAQGIDSSGTKKWNATGVAVSNAPFNQLRPRIVTDHSGGAIVTWYDMRSGGDPDIYIQNVSGNLDYEIPPMEPEIVAVSDIPRDQGGRVSVAWNHAAADTAPSTEITYYSVWRGLDVEAPPAGAAVISPADVRSGMKGKYVRLVAGSPTGTYWELVGTIASHYLEGYSYTAGTYYDSTGADPAWVKFFVSAHTVDPFTFYDSGIDSGYSVDNLSPIPPAGLLAAIEAGPQVKLTWNPPTDPDVGEYTIYRSTTSGFTPAPGDIIGTSKAVHYTDTSPVEGVPSYYRIIARDIHGNESTPSDEAEARMTVTSQFSVAGKWNIVSVPLQVSDYTQTTLFPTAESGAFSFNAGYTAYGVLQNGRGYWVKFSTGELISHQGFERTDDTLAVVAGWNMVGSLSTTITVSGVGSIPGGIVTSNFYRFDGGFGYSSSSDIEPGRGYWVKVAQAGHLVMTSTALVPATNRILIEDTGEMPPPPPEGSMFDIPGAYSLEQNYPNPFNPVTSIGYTLPTGGRVSLTIFNTLGQEVAVLVDEVQDAGVHAASFDAGTLPSGVYTYRISAGPFTDQKKMLFMK